MLVELGKKGHQVQIPGLDAVIGGDSGNGVFVAPVLVPLAKAIAMTSSRILWSKFQCSRKLKCLRLDVRC